MVSFTEAQLLGWIAPLLWPFLRALALMTALPVIGQRAVPMRLRVGLAGFIAFAAQASLGPMPVVDLASPVAWMMVAQQVVVGLTLGFSVRVVFSAVELAGELVGLQMGLNFAGFFDPVSASQGTASSRFLGTMTAFLFIVINGHLLVIAALVDSFQALPVSAQPLDILHRLAPQTWGADVFRIGAMLSLPIVGMLFFTNLTLGVISRVAPQINIFAAGFPITLSIGLLGLLFTLPMMQSPIQGVIEAALARFQ